MSASQLSSVRVIEAERRRGWGGSLFAFANILPSVTRGQHSVCVPVSRGWKEGHTMVLPLALNRFGLPCIFNPSNAKLSVVLFGGTLLKSVTVPHPSVSGDNGL